MGWEESEKHFLGLSYHGLQSLCKQHNLPANKSHSQLARSLAMLLEKENLNSGPVKENLLGSTQASHTTSSALLSNTKEASRCRKDNRKRGPSTDRNDEDRTLLHVKHKKGPETQMDQTLKSDHATGMTAPVSVNNAKADCSGRSCSGQGISHNGKSQSAGGIATPPELAIGNHDSAAHVNDQISFVAIHPGPNSMVSEPQCHIKVGGNGINKGSGSSNEILGNTASPFQLFVMSDDGIDLFVDLNSTPGAWVDSFKGSMCTLPSANHSETGIFSNSISSLVNNNDQNKTSSSGNIIMDIENKGAKSIAPCTSSLGSTHGENSRSEPCPPDATAVNSRSPASALPGTLDEISGSQKGVLVVKSLSSTSDVQKNMSLDMMAGGLSNNVFPQDSVDISERSHAPQAEDSIQPTSKKNTFSTGKTEVSVKLGCTQNVSDAYTDKASAFSSGNGVRRGSDVNSSPPSVEKDEMVDVTSGAQLAHNSDTTELLMENEQMEAVPMEEDNGHGDRLSICQVTTQIVAEQPATDPQSEASSADRSVAGNFNLTDPTPSCAASDNSITPLTSKHGEKAQGDDSVDKIRPSKPTRNILHSLRSAAARRNKPSTSPRRNKPSTSPRRSSRLVPK